MSDPRTGPLVAAVTALAPADEVEAGHRRAVLDLLATASEPFSANRFEPGHVTGSTMVVAPGRGVLLIHHPTLGRWLQPGGHVDPEDGSVGIAAAREALEETGLEVALEETPFDVDVHPIPARKRWPPHLHFDVRFVGLVEGLPAPRSDEGIEARWWTVAEAAALVEDQGLRRMLGKLAGRGLL